MFRDTKVIIERHYTTSKKRSSTPEQNLPRQEYPRRL